MIMKQIAAICKATKCVTLYDDAHGRQWVQCGRGYYPLDKLPAMEDADMLCNILDLSERDREKMQINRAWLPPEMSFEDVPSRITERTCAVSPMLLKQGSQELSGVPEF